MDPDTQRSIADLRSRSPKVRLAAADALAASGDLRAVGPLAASLRQTLSPGPAGIVAAIGIAVAAISLSEAFCAVVGWTSLLVDGAFLVIGFGSGLHRRLEERLRQRRGSGPLACALVAALLAVAERHPTLELQPLIPQLRTVAADLAIEGERDPRHARRTLQRLEGVLDQLEWLS